MKLFAKLSVLILLLLSLFVPSTYASGDTHVPTSVTLAKTEIVNHDYFAAADTVHLTGTVNGDAYIAGGTVVVDGVVNGDVLVAGGTVTISGQVKNDIRAAGGTVTVSGPVGGNVTAGAGTLLISDTAKIAGSLVAGSGTMDILSPIGKGATVGAGTLNLNAKIGGNMTAGAQMMTMQQKALVKGDLKYWSEEPVQLLDGATVAGELVFTQLPKTERKPTDTAQRAVGKFVSMLMAFATTMMFVTMIAVYLLGLALKMAVPEFTDHSIAYLRKSPLPAFGIGFLSTIVVPMVFFILFASVIGIPLTLPLLGGVIMMCLFGHIIGAWTIGNVLFGGEKAKVHNAWQLLVGMLVFGVMTFIPVLGWIAHAVIVMMGVGALLQEKYVLYRALRSKKLI